MKQFRQFLTEAKMTRDEALKILGLSVHYSADDLKVAYRRLTMQYHPDRNPGDKNAEEMIRKVNNAKDVLDASSTNGQSPADFRADYQRNKAEREAKDVVFKQVAWDAFDAHFQAHAFTNHFAKVFGTPFTLKETRNDKSTYGSYVNWTGEWANSDRTIVLDMSITVNYVDLFGKPVLSQAAAEEGLRLSIYTNILHNRKKVKLTQRDFKLTHSYSVLKNPEETFPAKKMVAQSSKAAARTMSKRDVLLTFTSELDARGDEDWMYVPVGAYRVALYRITLMRAGSWSIRGVYPAKGGSSVGGMVGYGTWLETVPEDMHRLWDGLKKLQKTGANYTPEEIAKACNALIEQQKREKSW